MGTFRHPLRNDWDNFRPTLMPLLKAPTADGAMARAMMKLMPAYLDYIEEVRDLREKDSHVLMGITSVLANIAARPARGAARDARQYRERMPVALQNRMA
jgi:hypothetical protein